MIYLQSKIEHKRYKDMARYDLSAIMKSAHTMRKFRPEKYPTFSDALKRAWKVAKFNKEIADRREETIAYHEAKKQEAQERKERTARIEAERAAMLVAASERRKNRIERSSCVEASGDAYGYGVGYHYSAFSGWGNYVGD